MADDVVSTGGAGQIAQESTLNALLQAVQGSGDSKAALKIKELGDKAGISSERVRALGESAVQSKAAFVGLTKSLIDGTATSSQLFGAFSSLGGGIGIVATGLSMLAKYQEESLAQYQKISSVGASFGGSLTDLRMAAANTYMTMDQFGSVITKNSDALSKMGGGVDNGVKQFAILSNSLLSSDVGRNLLALGYSTQEVNEGMLGYISATGGRTKAEFANAASAKAITDASAEYLGQLNGLAELTGKSRQKQQDELDEASKNASFQSYLQTLDEESRKKAMVGMANALATGGKGAVDAFQSKLMGVAPDKAGALFTATAGQAAESVRKSADAVSDKNKKVSDMNAMAAEAMKKAQQDYGKYGKEALYAIIRQGGPLADSLQQMGVTANKVRNMSEDEIKAMLEKKDLSNSEAQAMTDANANLKELGQALVGLINPVVAILTPVIKYISSAFALLGQGINALPGPIKTVISVAAALGITLAAYLALEKRRTAQSALSGINSALPSTPGAGGAGGGAGGGGFVSFITSLGRGLASLAPIAVPMLIGAGAVAGVIAILGAGVAAAIALIGVGLPVFSNGLKSIAEIDGLNLMKVAGALALLGPAMLLFSGSMIAAGLMTAGSKLIGFFTGGGPIDQVKTMALELGPLIPTIEKIGPALNNYATGIVAFGRAVASVDIGKAERLKEVMKGPGVLEGIGTAIRDVGAATAKLMTSNSGGQEKSGMELASLNNSIKELVKISREISDYTKQNVEATKKMGGDHFG